jgi:hypothetical protein
LDSASQNSTQNENSPFNGHVSSMTRSKYPGEQIHLKTDLPFASLPGKRRASSCLVLNDIFFTHT